MWMPVSITGENLEKMGRQQVQVMQPESFAVLSLKVAVPIQTAYGKKSRSSQVLYDIYTSLMFF